MTNGFNHIDENGNAVMVDVSDKKQTKRTAIAKGSIFVSPEVFRHIVSGDLKKGDALGTARIAGIFAAKRTWEIIPLCHPLQLTKVSVDFELDEKEHKVTAVCTAGIVSRTGVEMEALNGVSAALLTIYDMCKAVDKNMTIGDIHLVYKNGGRSGEYAAEQEMIRSVIN